ncbi:MAG: phosphoribosyl-AMP cyclohydrolase [Planctomycetales bacterium]|nr:phosphoribosyl-AMP cyclohydrolase [Planctomycetales bacterium]
MANSDKYALEEGLEFRPQFNDEGLIPAVASDHDTGELLMVAWMNRQALDMTLESGVAHFWSRSRGRLWRKGEESGNVQKLHAIYYDCDADTLLVKVTQVGGAACHEGYKSCFFRKVDPVTGEIEVVGERVFDPAVVYKKS